MDLTTSLPRVSWTSLAHACWRMHPPFHASSSFAATQSCGPCHLLTWGPLPSSDLWSWQTRLLTKHVLNESGNHYCLHIVSTILWLDSIVYPMKLLCLLYVIGFLIKCALPLISKLIVFKRVKKTNRLIIFSVEKMPSWYNTSAHHLTLGSLSECSFSDKSTVHAIVHIWCSGWRKMTGT